MAAKVLLEHRSPCRREGWSFLLQVGGSILAVYCGFLLFFFFAKGAFGLSGTIFLIAATVVSVALAALVLHYSILNIINPAEFLCRLDETSLECVSPVRHGGDTFHLPLAEIAQIEREDWDSNTKEPYIWHVRDHRGKRYWITANYDNPAEEFVEAIAKLTSLPINEMNA